MNCFEELADLIDELIYTDLAEQPENYEELKNEALEKMDEAYEILKKLGL